jgi:hypothetical protein
MTRELPRGTIRFRPAEPPPPPPRSPFVEPGRRLERFRPQSVPVTFGDGSTWFVPPPEFRICPVFDGGRVIGTLTRFGYRADVDDLVEQLAECDDRDVRVNVVATLAGLLLGENYTLDDDELDRLLCFHVDKPESWAWLEAVVRIATGRTESHE